MDTFESSVVAGTFATMPSATSATTIHLVDKLSFLRLGMYRHAYCFSEASSDLPFVASVLTQIVDQGYALHRMDPSFCIDPLPGCVTVQTPRALSPIIPP